ncbi:FAD binding domain-containing protein [Elusimicrobiota bacterium]
MFNNFDYCAPETLIELLNILGTKKSSSILAGGTDLLVNIRSGKLKPKNVIDIKKIKSLNTIKKVKHGIEIGASVTMNDISRSPHFTGPYSVLKQSASVMGCFEIRNRATIAGNIINASPGAETLTPLSVLQAELIIQSRSTTRTSHVSEFIKGVNKTALKNNELLTSVLLPSYPPDTKGIYMRRQRVKGMDLASINCCLLIINPGKLSKREVRFSLGTVATVPYRSKKAENILSYSKIDTNSINEAADIINSEISPRASSMRATPEYKRSMVRHFLKTGIQRILGGPF